MNKTIAEIVESLKTTGKCTIAGFGTFTTTVQKGREGISAFNNKPYKTDDKVVVKFKQSDSFDSSSFPVKK
jgi:nucleoid DNA-binding protein